MTTPLAEEFESHRSRLFGLAYRMLGSAAEAEDAVQDAYLRFSSAVREDIGHPAAWLAKVVTHLCLNRLTSARARRERYPGSWLPEPVLTSDGTLGPQDAAEQRDSVSTALLLLLERLTPTERAVYVLRTAFAYSHREISGVLDLSEANARQLYRRAARHAATPERRFTPAPEEQRSLLESFLAAAREGDVAGLERLLAEGVIWSGDSGGRVRAARRPIEGRTRVARFLAGGAVRLGSDREVTITEVNGALGLLSHDGGTLVAVATFEVRDGLIAGVQAIVNPDKLIYVTRQLADLRS